MSDNNKKKKDNLKTDRTTENLSTDSTPKKKSKQSKLFEKAMDVVGDMDIKKVH